MRQTSCKRIFILLINLCILISLVKAQDSTKASQPVTKDAVKPVVKKPITKPNAKTVTPTPQKTITPAVPKTVTQPERVDNSLNGQYEALLKHSWMQQGYKVINPGRLTNLWKSVNDSLNRNKRQLAEAKQKLNEQAKQISELKNQGTSKGDSTDRPRTSVDEIQVLGMSVDMTTYNWVVWGLILILSLALAAILFTTTKSSYDSKQHKQLYEEVSTEFQAYKAKTKEKELKLARELQTERNTIEELLAKRNEEGKRSKK